MSAKENKRLAGKASASGPPGTSMLQTRFYASDYVNHQHHHPDDPRDLRGTEAIKTFATEFREAFPDFHDAIDIQIAEGDMVATRFTSRGTYRGAFMGVEPTNRELTWTGITIDRISPEGKLRARSWRVGPTRT